MGQVRIFFAAQYTAHCFFNLLLRKLKWSDSNYFCRTMYRAVTWLSRLTTHPKPAAMLPTQADPAQHFN